jgi:AcrR family transcriptional regulator
VRGLGHARGARDGFQKTNLRAVAATAGVSAGLVIHHFGSKEKLRAAYDDHVLRILVQRARDDTVLQAAKTAWTATRDSGESRDSGERESGESHQRRE